MFATFCWKLFPPILLLFGCHSVTSYMQHQMSKTFMSGMVDSHIKGAEERLSNISSFSSPRKPAEEVQTKDKKAKKGDRSTTEHTLITSADILESMPKYLRYTINTGKQKKPGNCEQFIFLSPGERAIHFSLSDYVHQLKTKSCSWVFRGLESCRVTLSCSSLNLTKSCDKEYVEVVDGAKGQLKICNGIPSSFKDVSASGNLRDLYVNYRANHDQFDEPTGRKLFQCTASCAEKHQFLTPLFGMEKAKTNTKCYCGTKQGQTRIVGGRRGNGSEVPWLASIVKASSRQNTCGGALINSKYVLTANHCIARHMMNRTNMQVVFHGQRFDQNVKAEEGKDSPVKTYSKEELSRLDKGNGSLRFNVAEIIYHPKNVLKRHDFDVALLKLEGEVPLGGSELVNSGKNSPNIRAICLPELGNYDTSYAGTTAQIAGYGKTNQSTMAPGYFHYAEVGVMSPEQCAVYFPPDEDDRVVRWRMMCAGYKEGGIDTCQGDSGGPLMLEETSNKWKQIGIVSWGAGCGDENSPGMYFRTTEVVQWIHYVVNHKEEGKDAATWCLTPA